VLSLGLKAVRGAVEPLTVEAARTKKTRQVKCPGLQIKEKQRSTSDLPRVILKLPSFTINERMDLDMDMCGLSRARDPWTNHFPGIATNEPISIRSAEQQLTASFMRRGFAAGAYTYVAGGKAGAPQPKLMVVLDIDIKREFGFIVLERESGLLLFAGWVTEDEWTTIDWDETPPSTPEASADSDSDWSPRKRRRRNKKYRRDAAKAPTQGKASGGR
jgi:hypothetical protein